MVNNHRIARVPYKIPDSPYFSLLPTYFFDDPILASDYLTVTDVAYTVQQIYHKNLRHLRFT